MPVRAQALTMHYFATDADGPKTGDVGNHTLRVIEDGVIGTIAASPEEVDATNAPGMYKVVISAAENTADVVTLCGKSSSSGTTISPSTWTNITNADADAATAAAASAPSAAAVADAVWDEATSGHTYAGTFGEQVKVDMDDLVTKATDTYSLAAGNSGKLDTIDNFIDTEIAAILADTGTTLNDKIDVIDGIVDSILASSAPSAASIADAVWDEATSGHTTGGTFGEQVKTDIDAILVDTSLTLPATTLTANVKEINGSSDSADQLALSAGVIIVGEVDSTSFTPTTTQFVTDTGLATSINHYVGRIIIFTSGNLVGQAQEITAYMDGSDKKFTTSTWTEAPANNDDFVII